MNINGFFIFLTSVLVAIFFFFEPMDIKENKQKEVPIFQVHDFTLYELNLLGLSTFMKGLEGTRYSDKYEVQKINYTDSSREYLANMTANKGIYKDKVVELYGDIFYTREDGFRFEAQEANYNKVTAVAQTDNGYRAFMGEHSVVGSWLQYNHEKETARSKNVRAVYTISEENK